MGMRLVMVMRCFALRPYTFSKARTARMTKFVSSSGSPGTSQSRVVVRELWNSKSSQRSNAAIKMSTS